MYIIETPVQSFSQGGPIEALTDGQTLEWAPVVSADGKHVFFIQSTGEKAGLAGDESTEQPQLSSNLELPPLVAIKSVAPEFSEEKLVVPQVVSFKSTDGLQIYGQLFMPRGSKSRPKATGGLFSCTAARPARCILPGTTAVITITATLSISIWLLLAMWYCRSITDAELAMELSSVSPEYRDRVEPPSIRTFWPQLNFEKPSAVDPKRIGLWGGSYGGYLTALGLARNSDIFAPALIFMVSMTGP
jgi:hypothetical protein